MAIGSVSPAQLRDFVIAAGTYSVTATLPTPATTVNGFVGSITVTGVALGDLVLVAPTTALTAGVSYQGTVTAANTIAITVSNGSGGGATGGSKTLNVLVFRLKMA
jgi:hypothetical protein